jgi:hypothetical protein
MIPILIVISKKAKSKIKCKFVPMPAVKIWGSIGIAPLILDLGFRGNEWLPSHPSCFASGVRAHIFV